MSKPPQDLVERLSSQISQLQDGFEKLAKASTLKDMARLFTGILQKSLPEVSASIFHLESAKRGWEKVFGEGREDSLATITPTAKDSFSFHHLDGEGRHLGVIQPLADKSFLGVTLARTSHDGYTDLDKISVHLCVQLFANAYQPFLQRRNEKELVFSLNHRVLQLNSLIDTGIEVSKLKQDGSLHQLALERAASLTNASRGLLVVSNKDREIERYAFPEGEVSVNEVDDANRIQSSFEFSQTTYDFELGPSNATHLEASLHIMSDHTARTGRQSLYQTDPTTS